MTDHKLISALEQKALIKSFEEAQARVMKNLKKHMAKMAKDEKLKAEMLAEIKKKLG